MNTTLLIILLGSAALLLLVVYIRYIKRQKAKSAHTKATRAVALLVSGQELLVMQQSNNGRLRSRVEVPKGKAGYACTSITFA
jgi:hypothetical protein